MCPEETPGRDLRHGDTLLTSTSKLFADSAHLVCSSQMNWELWHTLFEIYWVSVRWQEVILSRFYEVRTRGGHSCTRPVLTAKTRHILTPHIKEGVESLHFRILLGQRTKYACGQQSSADFQYCQMVKSHFAVRSSGQAVKVTVQLSWPQS